MTAGSGGDAPSPPRTGRSLRGGLLAVAAAVLVLTTTIPASGPARAEAPRRTTAAVTSDPLQVTLGSLAPAVVPRTGPVRLTGTVTNVSDDTWTTVNVYPFLSSTPITTTAGLADAADVDPVEVTGERIVDTSRPATFATLDRIDPGESASYSVRIPHDLLEKVVLPDAPGVYWVGVQVLGADRTGRDALSDGRAYTFVPQLRREPRSTRAALVVPVRRPVAYNRQGSLRGLGSWHRDLGPDGRLTHLLQLGEAAPAGRLTWLVDPAVLDAVRRIAAGDPVRALTTAPAGPGDDQDGQDDQDDQDGEEGGGTTTAAEPVLGRRTGPAVTEAQRLQAQSWLTRFTTMAGGEVVLGLPYGDLDVSAAAERDPDALTRALALSATTFTDLGITARPAVSAPGGWLAASTLDVLPAGVTVLATDLAVPNDALEPGRVRPTTVLVGGHAVDLWDAEASSGGPGGETTALDVRQRVLAETGLRTRRPTPAPVVVSLPSDWDPGSGVGAFFSGLAQPWLGLLALPSVQDPAPPTVDPDALAYPEREREDELTSLSFIAADDLERAGSILQTLLVGPTSVGTEVTAQALTGLSYAARETPRRWAARAGSARDVVRALLRQVTVSAPEYVTLSSAAGNRFRVDVVNDLGEAVRVKIDPVVDDGLRIGTPGAITIEGGASASVLLTARVGRLGFHQVDLELTTAEGTRIGSGAELPVRSSRTGRTIWVIIAGGAALLFGAIAARLLRRYRRYRAARAIRARAARSSSSGKEES